MTTTITPVSQYDAATLTRAADGEDAYMDGGSAPLGTVLQKFADRAIFARDAVIATLGWNGDFSVDAGGTNSTFAVNLGTIGAVVTGTSASVYKVLAGGGVAIGASKILGGGNLANSTWYYVYCWDNAGTLDYEITTTAPSGSRRTKSGDATRRYLGCFRTTSAGAPIPLFASNGHYVYDVGGSLIATLTVVTSGTASSYTSVPCAALVPPHARLARLAVSVLGAAVGVSASVSVQSYGSASTGVHSVSAGQTNLEVTTAEFECRVDSSQRAQYKVNGGGGTACEILVYGFRE